jgi:uroporphyrinogen-III synthase
MHVLITRPRQDAAELKSSFEALGCEVTVAPLLEIHFNDIAADALHGAAGLIVTSRNGLRSISVSPAFKAARSLPVFVVGPATAELARILGFKDIRKGAETAVDLVHVISRDVAAGGATLIHVAGDHLAFDLSGALESRGIRNSRIEAYRSVAVKSLPDTVPQLLEDRGLNAVILMSPRSAAVWSDLVGALPQSPDLSHVVHICLSQAVATGLQSLKPARVEIAASPNSDEIVALVYRLAASRKTG